VFATNFWLSTGSNNYTGAVYECLKDVSQQFCCDLGNEVATGTWTPDERAAYVAVVSLPLSNCVLTSNRTPVNVTSVDAATSWSGLFTNVRKDSVDLTVGLQCNVSSSLPSSAPIVVTAVYNATGQPVSGLSMTLNATDGLSYTTASVTTNSSGIATYSGWSPSYQHLYNISALCAEQANNTLSVGSNVFDFRYRTNVTSQAGSHIVVVPGNNTARFDLKNIDTSGAIPAGMLVDFYVNGSYLNGTRTQYNSTHTSSTTLMNGTVSFTWFVQAANGTYSLSAVFDGNQSGNQGYAPCQGYACATCDAIALGVLFSVTLPNNLPGSTATLNATIIDVSTNTLYTGHSVQVNFTEISSNGASSPLGTPSTQNGMAYAYPYYITGCAHAYEAEIVPGSYAGVNLLQAVASSPVQLTVGNPTVLLLNVSQVDSSCDYSIYGWLESKGGGINQKNVTVSVNSWSWSQVFVNKTDSSGYFIITDNLPFRVPKGAEKYVWNTTYTVEAEFAGDAVANVTAWSTALDGTNYAVCTTVQYGTDQYGLEPASNVTQVMVNSTANSITQSIMSTDDVQHQAKNSGWMPPPSSEFGIFYPWYRLHFKFTPNGIFVFDVGISPLPFANTVSYTSALTATVTSLLRTAPLGIAIAIALSESLSQTAAQFGPEGFIAALLITTETLAVSYVTNLNSVEGLIGVFLGTLSSTVVTYFETLVLEGINIIPQIVDIVNGISHLWDFGFGTLYNMISVPINMAFMILTILSAIQLGAKFTWA